MSQILKFSVDGEPWENPGNLGAAWLLGRTCHLLHTRHFSRYYFTLSTKFLYQSGCYSSRQVAVEVGMVKFDVWVLQPPMNVVVPLFLTRSSKAESAS